MKAAVYNQEGSIELKEVALPEPNPGWVRLAVDNTGICGTDLHMYSGAFGPVTGVQPGHEIAGTVDAAGDGVSVASGSLVAVEPIGGCGVCPHCRAGHYNRCPKHTLFGVQRPGGMAEFITVPESALHTLPASVPATVRALAEPAAVCARGLRLARLEPGDNVAILGCGSIGLLAIVAAQDAGASNVFATARHPHQAELARTLGAHVFTDAKALAKAVGADALDVVIETVGGHASTLAEAVAIARRGGRIVMLGIFDRAPSLPGFDFASKELTLRGSYCYGRGEVRSDFGVAVDLVTRHAHLLEPMVTHRFKLDQVGEAFATAADKGLASIKVQIEP